MTQSRKIRVGTRGSPLALAQACQTRSRLMQAHGLPEEAFEIVVIKTSGDRIQDRPLADLGGKGLFTKEIEEALIAGEIDVAVHSMKDVPTELPAGLGIVAYLPRADVRDALITATASRIPELPAGAVVGTSSLRRQAQLRNLRPDLRIVPFRGNVETRLRKLREGEAMATILAMAGLKRLGLDQHARAAIEPEEMLPAVAQGAIGIEARLDDAGMCARLAAIHHQPTGIELAAERAFLARLDGSCRTPIAALARLEGSRVTFRGEILAVDGGKVVRASRDGSASDAERLGRDAAEEVLRTAGPGFLSAGT
ncbi:MAG TPA: hydroxymethylbilane synthase [Hyphomicrobiaceae bacterium]|nr:hydroxymethylbilane synthase [Hyphomicrobiaceae bacterium]